MTSPQKMTTSERQAILSWLGGCEDEMAEMLSRLIAVPTENPPGKYYRACVDILERLLVDSGLSCKRLAAPATGNSPCDAPESLLAHYGTGDRTLYFHGHYDVVPAQSPEQFQPQRNGHFLFGRGSADMKGGIVAMLYAIRALQATAAPLQGRITVVLVPDEETGGEHGSACSRGRACSIEMP
jgi:succinyl-diaminopimelate desuccinylase